MAGQDTKIRFGERSIKAGNNSFGQGAVPVSPQIILRKPMATDGSRVTSLIAHCPPLDTNSAYCNLLQCTHFAGTCVLAERDGEIIGWISGYRPPNTPEQLFVWQLAVSSSARGEGLAINMLSALLQRCETRGVSQLITTITPGNKGSWAVFHALARRYDARLTHHTHFERDAHFAGRHDTEHLVSIIPASGGFARTAQESQ